jgi:hypothetical protein
MLSLHEACNIMRWLGERFSATHVAQDLVGLKTLDGSCLPAEAHFASIVPRRHQKNIFMVLNRLQCSSCSDSLTEKRRLSEQEVRSALGLLPYTIWDRQRGALT